MLTTSKATSSLTLSTQNQLPMHPTSQINFNPPSDLFLPSMPQSEPKQLSKGQRAHTPRINPEILQAKRERSRLERCWRRKIHMNPLKHFWKYIRAFRICGSYFFRNYGTNTYPISAHCIVVHISVNWVHDCVHTWKRKVIILSSSGPFEKTHKKSTYIFSRQRLKAIIFRRLCTLSRVVWMISRARKLHKLLFYVLFVTCIFVIYQKLNSGSRYCSAIYWSECTSLREMHSTMIRHCILKRWEIHGYQDRCFQIILQSCCIHLNRCIFQYIYMYLNMWVIHLPHSSDWEVARWCTLFCGTS